MQKGYQEGIDKRIHHGPRHDAAQAHCSDMRFRPFLLPGCKNGRDSVQQCQSHIPRLQTAQYTASSASYIPGASARIELGERPRIISEEGLERMPS